MAEHISVHQLLQDARQQLPRGEFDNPVLDSIVLLAFVMGISKEQLYARFQDPVNVSLISRYRQAVDRRSGGEPLAYITGTREFYGHEFTVDKRVLIPRPDTETLVEWVLESHRQPVISVHDCCTGSGAIALALAIERPKWNLSASDISADAGELFQINAQRLLAENTGRRADEVPWSRSDLLTAFEPDTFGVITSNPPYLLSAECDEKDSQGWVEPRLALDGGNDGLDLIRRLIEQALVVLKPGGCLYIEAADSQADTICKLLEHNHFRQVEIKRDLAGKRRITRGWKA